MRLQAFMLIAVSALASCTSLPAPALEGVVIGTRRGEQDAVDPTSEIEAGTRKDLAATVAVRGDLGWVMVTWTAWGAGGQVPRVVFTKMVNTAGPTTIFAHLDADTERGGWKEGTYTCDFKAGRGQVAAGTIRVSPKRR